MLFERTKQVVEPSGAVALAALLAGEVEGDDVGVVLSGGNVDLRGLLGVVERVRGAGDPGSGRVLR